MRDNNFRKHTMATYKKRGYKPKTQVEKQQNIEDGSTTAEVFNTLDETASKTEDFVAKNQKYIFIVIGLVALVVLASLGYKEFIAKPKQEAAMNDMFQAQKYFDEAVNGTEKDSLYNLALNGGEGKFGLLDINIAKRQVMIEQTLVDLTGTEFDLLLYMARQPGLVFSRSQLLDKVWGYHHSGYEHTVNSHINRLRTKLEKDPSNPEYVLTVWGVGYKFTDTNTAAGDVE